MNNEWITDRLPTKEDIDCYGCVWTTDNGKVGQSNYVGLVEGTPWMPICKPEPYVKPKRWTVEYYEEYRCWVVEDARYMEILNMLDQDNDEHRKAAERIATIYEEVTP
jgi:hypothetical protein